MDSKACWTLGRWLGFEKRRENRKFMTRCFTKAQNLRRFYFVIPLLIADDADRNAVISRSADGRSRFQNFLTGAFATEMHLCLPTKLKKKQPYMNMEEMERKTAKKYERKTRHSSDTLRRLDAWAQSLGKYFRLKNWTKTSSTTGGGVRNADRSSAGQQRRLHFVVLSRPTCKRHVSSVD